MCWKLVENSQSKMSQWHDIGWRLENWLKSHYCNKKLKFWQKQDNYGSWKKILRSWFWKCLKIRWEVMKIIERTKKLQCYGDQTLSGLTNKTSTW